MGNQKRKQNRSPLEHAFGRSKRFTAVPEAFLDSECFKSLSSTAKALYLDLCHQYRPPNKRRYGNNGDLTLGRHFMAEKYGWNSPATLQRARDELKSRKILLVSRMPTRKNVPILYALSTHSIDYIDDGKGKCKHDLKPTNEPPDDWRQWQASAAR